MGLIEPLPYWQVNVEPHLRTAQPPPFLEKLSAKDERIVSTPDSSYTLLPWPEVQALILSNRIDAFQRLPSDLRRYLEFNYRLKQEYGSVMEFVLKKRLGWTEPIKMEGQKPWEVDSDIKVLWNDWPYGIDKKIVHLVIWTKFELEDDPETDDLTPQARAEIDRYVTDTFCSKVGKDNVIWFKNWKSLKSVHAVEHFHVMLYDPPQDFVDHITNGDSPLSQKLISFSEGQSKQ